MADFTYIWTAQGWLYVAAVIDLFSRRVVGWSMSDAMTAQLVTDALMMAIWRRGKPDALLHHSDQGSQYTSEQFQRLMADNGVTCLMSRSGNVWDNAAMESFFSSLKTERIARKTTARAIRQGRTCSIASNASTIPRAGTRPWAISAPWTSRSRLMYPNLVSMGPAAAQYVKLNGEMVYLWRAVDHEGELLESYTTKKRDKSAALAFIQKTLKRHGHTEAIVTDGL